MSVEQDLLALMAGLAKVSPIVGTVVSRTSTMLTIDSGNGRFPAKPAMGYLPVVGEQVWVLWINESPYVMGPVNLRPGTGVVATAPSNGYVSVSTEFGTISCRYNLGLMLTSGMVVKLSWPDGPYVDSVSSASPTAAPAPATPAPSPVTTHIDEFPAGDAGSYRSGNGWWTPSVYSSDSNQGAWFYGSAVADTLPDSASIQKVEVFSSIQQVQVANAVNFATHAYGSKPAGAPSFGTSSPQNVADNTWITLPNSFGDFLKANVGGVGVNHGGYTIFNSLASDARSGRLRITSTY